MAAAAVGTHFGVAEADITQALSGYQPTNQRSEFLDTGNNHLIVDAYNANPTSMAAALDNFKQISHPEKMVILGEMRELGASSAEEHRRILLQLSSLSCKAVWLVGEAFSKELPQTKHIIATNKTNINICTFFTVSPPQNHLNNTNSFR